MARGYIEPIRRYDQTIISLQERVLELNSQSAFPINTALESYAKNVIQETVRFIANLIEKDPDVAFTLLFPDRKSTIIDNRKHKMQTFLKES